ncbi:hypothetical protein ECANGB1_703 [Enterospora canceri]|uniref:Uncharacterized protein n=1 Tax=Enterospora canceri TaxID=1081671 RepID=A0A1Y1S7M5_9MICR|nr:hypothetical protein ECANGB1_703 [Enterospora canceri]
MKFNEKEIDACRKMAGLFGYSFDEQAIETMLMLLKNHMEADDLIDILKNVKKEYDKRNPNN